MVELIGEAYFDVVHKSHSPFLVKQGDHIVRVLGTEFNLKNYGNGSFETTLVRGKVEVQSTVGGKNIVLRPGFQFKSENNVRSVEKVDVMSYVGWKEGVFYFHGLNLPEVLGQIERWYDIEIPKQGIPNVPVYGEIARTTPIGEVLELLTLVTELKFNLRGRRLQISN